MQKHPRDLRRRGISLHNKREQRHALPHNLRQKRRHAADEGEFPFHVSRGAVTSRARRSRRDARASTQPTAIRVLGGSSTD